VPRRLTAPDPPLRDDAISLEPLARSLAARMAWVTADDPETARFTLIPSQPDGGFLDRWLGRYEDGWQDGSCAGFAVCDGATGDAIGFAAYVHLELERQQGEIGYVLAPAARGRGAATRAVSLLTGWGFDELGLHRIELRIDPANEASARVAERSGYRLEGVHRSTYFEGLRSDVAVWSRLRHD
jgi:RimJ/RimL family protein N-acetyltransferase